MCLGGVFPEANPEMIITEVFPEESRAHLPQEEHRRHQFGCIVFVAGCPLEGGHRAVRSRERSPS